jgi:hypothetical protein
MNPRRTGAVVYATGALLMLGGTVVAFAADDPGRRSTELELRTGQPYPAPATTWTLAPPVTIDVPEVQRPEPLPPPTRIEISPPVTVALPTPPLSPRCEQADDDATRPTMLGPCPERP